MAADITILTKINQATERIVFSYGSPPPPLLVAVLLLEVYDVPAVDPVFVLEESVLVAEEVACVLPLLEALVVLALVVGPDVEVDVLLFVLVFEVAWLLEVAVVGPAVEVEVLLCVLALLVVAEVDGAAVEVELLLALAVLLVLGAALVE